MEDILNEITVFADEAHGSQMRKYTPERYIVHPIRVMQICRDYENSLPILAAALLHDVLEDTEVTKDGILIFLKSVMPIDAAEETLRLVEEMTDVYVKAAYPQWNRKQRKAKELERIANTSPKAQTIKYADIIDNTKEIVLHDRQFAPRYLRECYDILLAADKGNPDLYAIALNEVKSRLQSVGSRL